MSAVETKPITPEEMARRLRAIHYDVQTKIHDQWDHMEADYMIECLMAVIEQREWHPITVDSLPQVGDEVLHNTGHIYVMKARSIADAVAWLRTGYTHHRPLNLPEEGR